jgi:hypothetical protein
MTSDVMGLFIYSWARAINAALSAVEADMKSD